MAEHKHSDNTRLIIGLDFGTTYTGVAFCDSSVDPNDVNSITVVHNWPGTSGNATKEKVPSEIAYGNFKDGETELWGGSIPPNVARHVWLKLRLDEAIQREELDLFDQLSHHIEILDIENQDPRDDNPPDPPGKQPVDMITDYLRGVNSHVLRVLNQRHTPSLLRSMAFEVVVTVPAVWSDRAKDLTFKAVTRAGFGEHKFQISMVAEPEAAAIYVMKDLGMGVRGGGIQVGNHFVLCDAGGGTVDIISYKVCSVSPHLQIEEAAVGTGAKCGSTFVDRKFKAWLKKKLGTTLYNKIKKEKLMTGSKIMNEFEKLKTSFTGTRPNGIGLTLPREVGIDEDPSRQIEDGEILVMANDLREMFDPQINKTLELINGQVSTVMAKGGKVKYIFLVGGFGNSDYMFQKVQEYCTARGFETRRPSFPWSSVARGAVARGMEAVGNNPVRLRLCRRHYGVRVLQRWDPSIHYHSDDIYIHEVTNEKMAAGQMRWVLGKGDSLNITDPKRVTIEFCRKFELDGPRIFDVQLAACEKDDAPRRYRDKSVEKVCMLNANLSDVPDSKFQRAWSSQSDNYYIIAKFQIEIIAHKTMLNFRLVFDGKEYDSVKANYGPNIW